MSNFTNALALSQQKEKELAAVLKFRYPYAVVNTTQQKGEFSGFDVEVVSNGTKVTYELKYDLRSEYSGKVAIELYRYNIEDKKIDSGLSATKATYQVFCFPDLKGFYLFKTRYLRFLLKNQLKPNTILGGDGNRTVMSLVCRKTLLLFCLDKLDN